MTVYPSWRRPARIVGSRPWTPADTTTALWLDANDATTLTLVSGAVSQWNDKSGRGYNLSQATASQRPAYSSTGYNSAMPVVTFDGSNDILSASNGQTGISNISMFIAMRYVSATGEDLIFGFGQGGNTSRYLYTSGSTQGFAAFSNDVPSSSISIDAGGNFHLFEVVQDGTSVYLWRDGVADTTLPRPINTPGTISSESIALGGYPISGSYYGNIAVLEAIAFYEAVSTATRQNVEGYLAWKWGLASSLPSSHPYKLFAPIA